MRDLKKDLVDLQQAAVKERPLGRRAMLAGLSLALGGLAFEAGKLAGERPSQPLVDQPYMDAQRYVSELRIWTTKLVIDDTAKAMALRNASQDQVQQRNIEFYINRYLIDVYDRLDLKLNPRHFPFIDNPPPAPTLGQSADEMNKWINQTMTRVMMLERNEITDHRIPKPNNPLDGLNSVLQFQMNNAWETAHRVVQESDDFRLRLAERGFKGVFPPSSPPPSPPSLPPGKAPDYSQAPPRHEAPIQHRQGVPVDQPQSKPLYEKADYAAPETSNRESRPAAKPGTPSF